MMKYVKVLLKLIVSLTIINVWTFRANKSSIYRGGESVDMVSEFISYGLSIKHLLKSTSSIAKFNVRS